MSLEALPDDICKVCNTTRENHGDLNHYFSNDGSLIPRTPPGNAQKQPPKVKPEHATKEELLQYMSEDLQAKAVMRLTEVLLEKGLIDGKDTIYIYSGNRSS